MQHYTIATLGSHSALQILKGAKDEGFKTLVVTLEDRENLYSRFSFIDEIVKIKKYSDFFKIEPQLKKRNCILIPHGSFVAYLGDEGNKKISTFYYGNKQVLDWEGDRDAQYKWLKLANITLPQQFTPQEKINYPIIVKSYGAAGGIGYFYAKNKTDFQKKLKSFVPKKYIIQEYVIGVTIYFHYFYSPLNNQLELMSIDKRYETNVDSLGRIPHVNQQGLVIDPSFVVVGNSPLVVSESLLPQVYAMGERVVSESKKLMGPKGLYGPFCLETVITPNKKIYAIEISCRIVAGTNLFVHGSPYSWLMYNEPMSTGRRIAREIKIAIEKKQLEKIID